MGTVGDPRTPDAGFTRKIARENGQVGGDVGSLGVLNGRPARATQGHPAEPVGVAQTEPPQ